MPIGILKCNKNNLLSSAKECLSRRDNFKCERILCDLLCARSVLLLFLLCLLQYMYISEKLVKARVFKNISVLVFSFFLERPLDNKS